MIRNEILFLLFFPSMLPISFADCLQDFLSLAFITLNALCLGEFFLVLLYLGFIEFLELYVNTFNQN